MNELVSRDDKELAIIHVYLVVAEKVRIRNVDPGYLDTSTSKMQ